MCRNKVNLSNFVTKPWLIVAYDGYYPSGRLYNIRAAFETQDEADDVWKSYTDKYDFVQVVNIVEYLNKTFGE